MKNIDFTTIYNIPEEISGLGFKAHFIGLCLFFALFICAISCVLVDETWIKDLFDLIISSGIFVILGFSIILILCPLYFLARFVMEIFKFIKAKKTFYSTLNIKYIKLENELLKFVNTIDNNNFNVSKSEVQHVILSGEIHTFISPAKFYKAFTYIEKLKMRIILKNTEFTIYPNITEHNIVDFIIFLNNYFGSFELLFKHGDYEYKDITLIKTALKLGNS